MDSLQCVGCDYVAASLDDMHVHFTTAHMSCENNSSNVDDQHSQVLHCQLCPEALENRNVLIEHYKVSHNVPESFVDKLLPKEEEEESSDIFVKEEPGIVSFDDSSNFEDPDVAVVKCSICNFPFASNRYLMRHLSTVHNLSPEEIKQIIPEEAAAAETEIDRICKICNVILSCRPSLKRHYLLVHKLDNDKTSMLLDRPSTARPRPKHSKVPVEEDSFGGDESYHGEESYSEAPLTDDASYMMKDDSLEMTYDSDSTSVCKICQSKLSCRTSLRRHYSLKHKLEFEEINQLLGPSFRRSTKIKLDAQLEEFHSMLPDNSDEDPQVDYTLSTCKICKVVLSCRPSLKRHYFLKHKLEGEEISKFMGPLPRKNRELSAEEIKMIISNDLENDQMTDIDPNKDCKICQAHLSCRLSLKRHYLMRHKLEGEEVFKLMGQPARKTQELSSEEVSMIINNELDEEELANIDPNRDCKICRANLSCRPSLKRHYSMKHKLDNEEILQLLGPPPRKGQQTIEEESQPIKLEEFEEDPLGEIDNLTEADGYYICKICRVSLSCRPSLKRHYFLKHKLEGEELSQILGPPVRRAPRTLDELSPEEINMIIYGDDQLGEIDPDRDCKICRATLSCRQSLKRHYAGRHKLEAEEINTVMGPAVKKPMNSMSDVTAEELQTAFEDESDNYEGACICKLCKVSLSCRPSLKRHYALVHKLAVEEINILVGAFVRRRVKSPEILNPEYLNEVIAKTWEEDSFVDDNTARTCKLCNMSLSSRPSLKRHYWLVHKLEGEERRLLLGPPAKKLPTPRDTDSDVFESKMDTKALDQVCKMCESSFAFRYGLKRHYAKAHGLNPDEIDDLFPMKYRVLAETNDMINELIGELREPLKDVSGLDFLQNQMPNLDDDSDEEDEDENSEYECDICHSGFDDETSLLVHVSQNHLGGKSVTTLSCSSTGSSVQDIPCFVKLEVFENEEEFNTVRKDTHVCDVCHQQFSTRAKLKKHFENEHYPGSIVETSNGMNHDDSKSSEGLPCNEPSEKKSEMSKLVDDPLTSLKEEMSKSRLNSNDKSSNSKISSFFKPCPDCGEAFDQTWKFIKHLEMAKCSKSTSIHPLDDEVPNHDSANLDIEEASQESYEPQRNANKRSYSNDEDQNIFENGNKRAKVSDNSNKCAYCGENFSNEGQLLDHFELAHTSDVLTV